jgi:hypothetical protein
VQVKRDTESSISSKFWMPARMPFSVFAGMTVLIELSAIVTQSYAPGSSANKVSQRPEARPTGGRMVNKSYITGNYHLQGGNLQAK